MVLSGIDFSRVSLRGASLHATNLMKADLRGADLSGANLAEADLMGPTSTERFSVALHCAMQTCSARVSRALRSRPRTSAALCMYDLSSNRDATYFQAALRLSSAW